MENDYVDVDKKCVISNKLPACARELETHRNKNPKKKPKTKTQTKEDPTISARIGMHTLGRVCTRRRCVDD